MRRNAAIVLFILIVARCVSASRDEMETDAAVMEAAIAHAVAKVGVESLPVIDRTISVRAEDHTSFVPAVEGALYARLLSRNQHSVDLSRWPFLRIFRLLQQYEIDDWMRLTASEWKEVTTKLRFGVIGISLPAYSEDGLRALVAFDDIDLMPATGAHDRLVIDHRLLLLHQRNGQWHAEKEFGYSPD